jgi:hypothetical protein
MGFYGGSLPFCRVCAATAARSRGPTRIKSAAALRPLGVLVVDMGEQPVRDLTANHKYFLAAGCKATAFKWGVTAARKSDLAAPFIELLRKLRATYPDYPIAEIHIDQGTELFNADVGNYARDHGITIVPSPRGRPDLNPSAERNVSILKAGVDTLLASADLDRLHWVWAFYYFIFVSNRRSRAQDLSPFERLNGEAYPAERIYPFGARVWPLEDRARSVGVRSSAHLLVGVSHKGYILSPLDAAGRPSSHTIFRADLKIDMTRLLDIAYGSLDASTTAHVPTQPPIPTDLFDAPNAPATAPASGLDHGFDLDPLVDQKIANVPAATPVSDPSLGQPPAPRRSARENRGVPAPQVGINTWPTSLTTTTPASHDCWHDPEGDSTDDGTPIIAPVLLFATDPDPVQYQHCAPNSSAHARAPHRHTPRAPAAVVAHTPASTRCTDFGTSNMRVTSSLSSFASDASFGPDGRRHSAHRTVATSTGAANNALVARLLTRSADRAAGPGLEPRNIAAAVADPGWKAAAVAEVEALLRTSLRPIPEGAYPLPGQVLRLLWVFKAKVDADGSFVKKKGRLAADGRSETNYDADLASTPTPSERDIRTFVALCAADRLVVEKVDVKNAYLHARLRAPVFVRAPAGTPLIGDRVYLLERALYGLHESGGLWRELLMDILRKHGLSPLEYAPCIFANADRSIIVIVYVDDLLCGSYGGLPPELLESLRPFGYTLERNPRSYVGYSFTYTPRGIHLSQPKYIDCLLAGISHLVRPAETPYVSVDDHLPLQPGEQIQDVPKLRGLVGLINYLANKTRPDIVYALRRVARNMHAPSVRDFEAVARIIRYVSTTRDLGLLYRYGKQKLCAFSDADWGKDDQVLGRSTSGMAVLAAGAVVDFASSRQTRTALSTGEAELVALSDAVRAIEAASNLLADLHRSLKCPPHVYTDSTVALSIAARYDHVGRFRHVGLRERYCLGAVARKVASLMHVPSGAQAADIFTKALQRPAFADCRRLLGLSTAH